MVAAGCSSSDQTTINKAVSPTLASTQLATAPVSTPMATRTPVPTDTPTPEATAVPTPVPAPRPEPTTAPTPTPKPTATSVPTLEPTATSVPTLEPTATNVPTLEPTATSVPTLEPTATNVPTPEPDLPAKIRYDYEPSKAITFNQLEALGNFPNELEVQLSKIFAEEFTELAQKAGMSLAVYQDGAIWSQALGYAKEGVPMEPSTPIGVKSSSKTFLSALVLSQIQAGTYKLTDRVSVLLSNHPDYETLDKSIIPDSTVFDLLSMTSGISEDSGSKVESFMIQTSVDWKPSDTLSLVKDPPKAPGKFEYNGIVNSFLLGMIAEHLSGQDLYTLYRTELLDPIEVQASLLPVVYAPSRIAHPHAERSNYGGAGFGDLTKVPIWGGHNFVEADGRLSWAGAGIVSTSENMARWSYELFSQNGSAVNPTVRETLLNSFSGEPVILAGAQQNYGFHAAKRNFVLSDGTVITSYGHPGGGSGTSSSLAYFPELDLAISVLANSDIGYMSGSCASRTEYWLTPSDCITIEFLQAFLGISGEALNNEQHSLPQGNKNIPFIDPVNPPKIATSNFIDLDSVIKITKLRSAYGHDYTFGDEEHDPDFNSCRSMKHYFDSYTYSQKTTQAYGDYDTKGNMRYYSPVAGELRDIMTNEFMLGQTEYQFTIISDEISNMNFSFMHVDLLEDLRKGASVEAGQHIGYVGRPYGQAEIVTWLMLGDGKVKYISFFDVMSDEIFSEYEDRGVGSRAQMTISREEREANPISCHPDNGGGKFIADGDELSFNIWQSGTDNWVFLNSH